MTLLSFRIVILRITSVAVTLWILSLVAFIFGQTLPGNVGRAILGPLADAQAVAALNHQLGTDKPLVAQYFVWLSNITHGDLGTSLVLNQPVSDLLLSALERSLTLAALTLATLIPVSVTTGVLAAVQPGRAFDWIANVSGMVFSVVPEFVWCIVLVLIFGLGLHWLPMFADSPPDASLLSTLSHLILPSIALGTGLFGYLTRMVRASTLQEFREYYTRTAVLKGLPPRTVLLRHVLRNSMPPAVAVIGTQLGYLIGGLVTVEALFRYPGIGSLMLHAAKTRDLPLLQGGMLLVGTIYAIGTQLSDALVAYLEPRKTT